jgi:EamA domain-containing membrane protein RarD
MKPIKEILRSPAFMREVSILFIGLAALSVVFSLLLFTGSNGDPEALSLAGGFLLQAIIYVVLGIMIRRGSVKALWVAGILFILDTLLSFLYATGSGFVTMILGRGLLIYLLIRYVLKQRRLIDDVES